MNTRLGDHHAQELHGHVGLHLVDGLHGGDGAHEDRRGDDQRQRADGHDVHLLEDLPAHAPGVRQLGDRQSSKQQAPPAGAIGGLVTTL